MSGENRLGGIFARAGFLPDSEKCRILAGAEIRYSPITELFVCVKLASPAVLVLFVLSSVAAGELAGSAGNS